MILQHFCRNLYNIRSSKRVLCGRRERFPFVWTKKKKKLTFVWTKKKGNLQGFYTSTHLSIKPSPNNPKLHSLSLYTPSHVRKWNQGTEDEGVETHTLSTAKLVEKSTHTKNK